MISYSYWHFKDGVVFLKDARISKAQRDLQVWANRRDLPENTRRADLVGGVPVNMTIWLVIRIREWSYTLVWLRWKTKFSQPVYKETVETV